LRAETSVLVSDQSAAPPGSYDVPMSEIEEIEEIETTHAW
jgi:hypothetical protein